MTDSGKTMEEFDYIEALKTLERIAALVEDPSTGLGDIDKLVKQSDELIKQCREYLRTVREKVDNSFE